MNLRRGVIVAACAIFVPAVAAVAAVADGAPAVDREAAAPSLLVDEGGNGNGRAGEPVPFFELLPSYGRWRSHTFNYFNSAKAFSGAVKQAAAAWNRSGMKGKWKPVSRGRADIIIKVNSMIGVAGLATSWNGNRGLIELNANTLKGKSPDARATQGGVVAHEMGHIIGLDHENGCATMNAVLWSGCKQPKEPWLYRCGLLQSDDIRGAVALLGGKAKKPGKEFCPLEQPPAKVTNLTGTWDAEVQVMKLSWSLPSKNAPAGATVRRGGPDGDCPKPGKGTKVSDVGRVSAKDHELKVGTYCYEVAGVGKFGRPGKSATVKAQVTGSAPEADFDYFYADYNLLEFTDYSFDGDKDITGWQWDFGDGSGSTEQNPTHLYAAPGDYIVTLTVRDASGHTSTASLTIYVEPL